MGIYYYKLFELMTEKGISQKSMMQRLGISSATFAKMRNNESVTLDVLDRIRGELGCDFGERRTPVICSSLSLFFCERKSIIY